MAKYKPRKLKHRKIGKASCTLVKMPNGKRVTLCVMAKPYGYAAWLQSGTKKGLVVPTGRARTLKSAKSNARKFLRSVARRSR